MRGEYRQSGWVAAGFSVAPSSLRVPLRRVSTLPKARRDDGATPEILGTGQSALVLRPGWLSGFTPSLKREAWAVEVAEFLTFAVVGDRILYPESYIPTTSHLLLVVSEN